MRRSPAPSSACSMPRARLATVTRRGRRHARAESGDDRRGWQLIAFRRSRPAPILLKVVPPAGYTAPSAKSRGPAPADAADRPERLLQPPVQRRQPGRGHRRLSGRSASSRWAASSSRSSPPAASRARVTLSIIPSRCTMPRGVDLAGVRVVDRLPLGFSFVKDSLRLAGDTGRNSKRKGALPETAARSRFRSATWPRARRSL